MPPATGGPHWMQNILVAVDFSNVSKGLLDQAARLAQAFQAKLWLIHVAPPDPAFVGYEAGPQFIRDQVAAHLQKEHSQLQDQAELLRGQALEVTPLLIQGQTIQTILNEAQRLQADLIILGSHGHGALHRALVGSVAEGVLRKAPCPVMIVPAPKD